MPNDIDLRRALVDYRERVIYAGKNPTVSERTHGVLRRAMIDHLVAWKPTDRTEWLLELPRPLAAGTDGDQFARFAPAIIALVARHVQMAGGSAALILRR